ncbi:MAG TPA: beta-propeller fold lactonase family protein [Verrucomicrobiae bacterium]|nr:beta-propeller fold lactonase family protein [Verrucomicrobiae bacterium]
MKASLPAGIRRMSAISALMVCLHFCAIALFAQSDEAAFDSMERVGRAGTNRVVLPVNQVITPAGKQIELPRHRPQVLALSPDGRLLVTAGKTRDIVVLNPETGAVIEEVGLPADAVSSGSPNPASDHILKPDKGEQVSFTGLNFSPDGSRLYLSNAKGSLKVFSVDAGHHLKGEGSVSLPDANAPKRKAEVPAGLAISKDGKKLYVAGNLSNRLLEFDLPSGTLCRSFEVGVAPYDAILIGDKVYVSNWGGRRPDADSVTGPAGRGTLVRVDSRSIACEGSVSEIDLKTGKVTAEILTGLHASALLAAPDGRHLLVANAGSDTVSVIDTRAQKVVETINVKLQKDDLFGAEPNALAMDHAGRTLYVCNGSQNAVAVIEYNPGKSKLTGLIPTGWYPGAVLLDSSRHQLIVANIKGTLPGRTYQPEKRGYNSHQHLGTLSLIPLPEAAQLKNYTAIVLKNYGRALFAEVFKAVRPGVHPVPVPERIGEPSVFKHVVYLVKENRTYDQVLGDIKEGNGDSNLCVFGERVTPNQHKMVRDFTLMDNMYCSGILSADGHQWATTGIATDYMEKSFADFPRSYPDMQEENDMDAMAYSPAGFIWDDALAHGRTVRDYGECSVAVTGWKDPANSKPLEWLDYYHDFVNHTGLITYSNYAGVASLQPRIMTNTVGWIMAVPDVFRAAQFISELRQFEASGDLPNLCIICLPNDHTAGTDPGQPIPAAQVADNDLAFGQIVDAISHSKFWKDTCIFAIEDDPQSGWDHVSGYRTTGYVISPYTKRHAVVSVNYNQVGILRTIELMLGLPPMNQMDASAKPMSECFTETPDFAPFSCVSNNIPLDEINAKVADIRDRQQRRDAIVSSRLPLAKPDQCPETVLNKIIWHAQMGFKNPYPKWAITEADDD